MANLSDLMGGRKFDASKVDTSNVIAAGTYKAMITIVEIKIAKASGKQYLSVEFTMLSPSVNSRKYWCGLHLCNDSATARAIAEKNLAKICLACGYKEIDDTSVLINKKLVVKIKVGKNKDGEPQNEFVDAMPWGSIAADSAPPQASAPAMPSVPDDDESPYWDAQQ
jgi:hypothetical protein